MTLFRCQGCQKRLAVRAQTPNQKFCSEKQCQLARKRTWQKSRRQNDPDYQANDQDSHRAWRKKNPDYYKDYRLTHPEYASRNREKQRERSQKKRDAQSQCAAKQLANVDVSISQRTENSGVISDLAARIANMDASISQLSENMRLVRILITPKDLANEDSWMPPTSLKRSG